MRDASHRVCVPGLRKRQTPRTTANSRGHFWLADSLQPRPLFSLPYLVHDVIFLSDSIFFKWTAAIIFRSWHLLKQVKESGSISEDHDVAKKSRGDQPDFLEPCQLLILIFDLPDSNHCLRHIEADSVDGVD